jgi:uncharacterized protein
MDPAETLQRFEKQKTLLLTTYKRDGSGVGTPVNLAVEGGRAFFRTYDRSWKAKRLRRNQHVLVAPSTLRGAPTGDAISGVARLLDGDEGRHAASQLRHKHPVLHGLVVPLMHRVRRYKTLHYGFSPEHNDTAASRPPRRLRFVEAQAARAGSAVVTAGPVTLAVQAALRDGRARRLGPAAELARALPERCYVPYRRWPAPARQPADPSGHADDACAPVGLRGLAPCQAAALKLVDEGDHRGLVDVGKFGQTVPRSRGPAASDRRVQLRWRRRLGPRASANDTTATRRPTERKLGRFATCRVTR